MNFQVALTRALQTKDDDAISGLLVGQVEWQTEKQIFADALAVADKISSHVCQLQTIRTIERYARAATEFGFLVKGHLDEIVEKIDSLAKKLNVTDEKKEEIRASERGALVCMLGTYDLNLLQFKDEFYYKYRPDYAAIRGQFASQAQDKWSTPFIVSQEKLVAYARACKKHVAKPVARAQLTRVAYLCMAHGYQKEAEDIKSFIEKCIEEVMVFSVKDEEEQKALRAIIHETLNEI